MKQTILGLAVLSTLSATAQAQSNVTLYGIVDIAVRNDTDVSAGRSRLAELGGMVNTSRWGLKGTEDLAPDLKANFILEGGISPDTGAQAEPASLFDRRATVGLSGSWGKLEVGRAPTFGWEYTPVYDPLGGALATPAPTSHASGKAALLVNGFMFVTNNPYNDTKLRDNNIKYTYTASNGVIAGLDYSAGETTGDARKKSGRQVMLGYMRGSWNSIVAYDRLHDAANLTQTVVTAGGNYRFANETKVTLGYSQLKADAAFAAASNVVTGAISNYSSTFGVAANGSIKVAVTAGGVEAPLAPAVTLNGSVYSARVSGDGIQDNRYNTYALLAKYHLSKRTFLYGALDHETATTHGGLATVSGHTGNTGVTAGIQTRF